MEIMFFKEECIVSICHYQALDKFLFFVPTALFSNVFRTGDIFRYIKFFKYWNPKLIKKEEVLTIFH